MIPTKTIQLDFWRHPTDILHLVQGEADGRQVTFKITDNGAAFNLTGYTVQFAVKKPDGNIVVNSATVTDAAGGIIDVVISSQIVAVTGSLHAELQITKTGQLSKSFRIVTKVAPGVDVDGIEPSVSEFNTLQTLIGQAADALEALDTALDTALGAPLSTLTTTDKTLVGAINEVRSQLPSYTAITWASDSRDWHDKPSGVYYTGSSGASQGYPDDFMMIYHVATGSIVHQTCGTATKVFTRRFNTSQAMTWKYVDVQAVT